MRNYCKFFLVTGTYDDEVGHHEYSQFFLDTDQASLFFSNDPFPGFVQQAAVDIWIALDKELLASHLNAAYSSGIYFPQGPPVDYLSSPRQILDENEPRSIHG